MHAWLIVCVCFGLSLSSAAHSAGAAVYTVQSCRDERGASIPASDASGGWTPEGVGLSRDVEDACSTSAARLLSSIGGAFPVDVGATAGWRFDPPAGTFIAGFRVLYSGYARPFDGRNQGVVGITDTEVGRVASHEGVGSFGDRIAMADGRHDQALRVFAQCDGPAGNPPCPAGVTHATVAVQRSLLTLADETPPESGTPRGSAVDLATWQGTQTLAAPVSDVGAGVYRWFVDADGTEVFSGAVDDTSRWCADLGDAGSRLFSVPRPCPQTKDLVISLDADRLPPGQHDIAVRITDAAGNSRTVFTARKTILPSARTIGPGTDPALRGTTNGVNSSDAAALYAVWTRTRRRTLSIAYGARPIIRGRLTTGEVGIGAARVELLAHPLGRLGVPIDKGGVRTRPDGRFTLVLPKNLSSRDLALRYRARANDTVPSAWASLRLRVRAAVRLAASPRWVAPGHATTLQGRLVAGPVPAGGKVLELQARDPGGRWLTFRTVRTTKRGGFRTRYHFRRPGPATFEMRVRSRASSDYPYATGTSRIIRVHVR